MNKLKTISLKGNDYAQVKERIKAFREDCPSGVIETKIQELTDGVIIVKAEVSKGESGGSATGQAYGKITADKAFEKLETVAVGRALAFLGYLADGEVASAEEMEEFIEYQKQQKELRMVEYRERLSECKNIEELKNVWVDLPIEAKQELEELKEELRKKHEDK